MLKVNCTFYCLLNKTVSLYFRVIMPSYQCETCGKTYRYKQNLKRHKTEKHSTNIEHWKCVEMRCPSKFIRRRYIFKHLILNHGYTSLSARQVACTAPRGYIQVNTYYENESEDESVFDLIDEIDRIRENNEKIVDFELDYLDDIRLGHDDAGYNAMTSGDAGYNAMTSGDMDNNLVVSGNVDISEVTSDNGEINVMHDDDLERSSVDGNMEARNSDYAAYESDDYESHDEFESGDTWDEDTIVISSDDEDELAVKLSELKTKTQTFMYTVTRK